MGNNRSDYYSILGIGSQATPEEIKRAYRQWMKKNHPDMTDMNRAKQRYIDEGGADETILKSLDANQAEYNKKTKEVNDAKEVLLNPDLRRAYDIKIKSNSKYDPPPKTQPNPPSIRVSARKLEFGSIYPSESKTQSVTIENTGGPVTMDVDIELENGSDEIDLETATSSGSNFPFPMVVKVTVTNRSNSRRSIQNKVVINIEGEVKLVEINATLVPKPTPAASPTPKQQPTPSSSNRGKKRKLRLWQVVALAGIFFMVVRFSTKSQSPPVAQTPVRVNITVPVEPRPDFDQYRVKVDYSVNLVELYEGGYYEDCFDEFYSGGPSGTRAIETPIVDNSNETKEITIELVPTGYLHTERKPEGSNCFPCGLQGAEDISPAKARAILGDLNLRPITITELIALCQKRELIFSEYGRGDARIVALGSHNEFDGLLGYAAFNFCCRQRTGMFQLVGGATLNPVYQDSEYFFGATQK